MKITPTTPEVVYLVDSDTPLESVEVDIPPFLKESIDKTLKDFSDVQKLLKNLYEEKVYIAYN